MRIKEIAIILCILVLIISPTVFILYTTPLEVYLQLIGIPFFVIIGGALLIKWLKSVIVK